jgi:hypothetical protein
MKDKANRLRAEGYIIKLVNKDREAHEEARSYGLRLPIKVIDGVAERI